MVGEGGHQRLQPQRACLLRVQRVADLPHTQKRTRHAPCVSTQLLDFEKSSCLWGMWGRNHSVKTIERRVQKVRTTNAGERDEERG